MSTNPEIATFTKLIGQHKNILITAPAFPSVDHVCGALGIATWLRAQDKQVNIMISGLQLPERFSFVHGQEHLIPVIAQKNQLLISVDVSKTTVKELSYDVADGKLNILITPQEGQWSAGDVSTQEAAPPSTCIITVGAPTLDSLGEAFTKQRNFFYETPIINIDNNPNNDNYGQVNIVRISPPSVSEVVADVLANSGTPLPEDTATNLLTGIISQTQNFRASTVMPKTLHIAANLLDHGASHEMIMQHLNYNKSIEMLQLWGAALQGLQAADGGKLLFTTVRAPLLQSIGDEHGLHDLIGELLLHAPKALVIIIFAERQNGTMMYATTKKHLNLAEVLPALTWVQRYGISEATSPLTADEIEKQVILDVRAYFEKA